MRSFAGYEWVQCVLMRFGLIIRILLTDIGLFRFHSLPYLYFHVFPEFSPDQKRFRLIDAFDLRPARATWAFRGLIRSKHQRRLRSKPKSTHKNILILKHFEAFWSYIFPGCGCVRCVDHDNTLPVANLSQRMLSLWKCAPGLLLDLWMKVPWYYDERWHQRAMSAGMLLGLPEKLENQVSRLIKMSM